jgi:hypothetical protein
MSETIDLTARMAAFLAKGKAVTVLDYAGNAVGEHRDIDLSQERILALDPEKTPRGATPKNKHIISAPSLGLPREGSVRAKYFEPAAPHQAEPEPVRPAEIQVPSGSPYMTIPDPNPVSITHTLVIVPVIKPTVTATVDVLSELRKIRKAVAAIGETVDRFERICRRA